MISDPNPCISWFSVRDHGRWLLDAAYQAAAFGQNGQSGLLCGCAPRRRRCRRRVAVPGTPAGASGRRGTCRLVAPAPGPGVRAWVMDGGGAAAGPRASRPYGPVPISGPGHAGGEGPRILLPRDGGSPLRAILMDPTVITRYGKVRGRVRDGVASFLGIPYAASPTGLLRFRPPAPPPVWDGIREADRLGATPPKPDYAAPFDVLLPEPNIAGDDWLTVNVWTPDPGRAGVPVMVWIHGGAFTHGNSAIPVYDGHAFARDGVVLVRLNHRLGIARFAMLPDAPANRRLLDQVAAWSGCATISRRSGATQAMSRSSASPPAR